MSNTSLYLQGDISFHDIDWPDNEYADQVQRYFLPIWESETEDSQDDVPFPTLPFFKNIRSNLGLLIVDNDLCLPITITSEKEYDNCFTCSPWGHYIDYGIVEVQSSPLSWVLKYLITIILHLLGYLFRWCSISKVVTVNNWMLTTNLYPTDSKLSAQRMRSIIATLTTRFPDHAIYFRSLNKTVNPNLVSLLSKLNFYVFGSRSVYLYEGNKPDIPSDCKDQDIVDDIMALHTDPSYSTDTFYDRVLVNESRDDNPVSRKRKKDVKALANSGYSILSGADFIGMDDDIERLQWLYNDLYLNRYSIKNVEFSVSFFEKIAIENNALQVRALRNNTTGSIDAVLGFFVRDGVMTTPVFGYDTSLPTKIGL